MSLLDGLLKWFQKKGAIGGIARWVHKEQRLLYELKPDAHPGIALDSLLRSRYKKIPPQSEEEQIRLNVYMNRNQSEYTQSGSTHGIVNRSDLCMTIAHIEMDLTPMDGKTWHLALESVEEELARLDRKHGFTEPETGT